MRRSTASAGLSIGWTAQLCPPSVERTMLVFPWPLASASVA
jgi:hypothetical protein